MSMVKVVLVGLRDLTRVREYEVTLPRPTRTVSAGQTECIPAHGIAVWIELSDKSKHEKQRASGLAR